MSVALPRIAVTMGDGAGIGPEIIVKALADPHVATMARAVVVGDALRLKQAADIAGVAVDIVTVDDVERGRVRSPGRINVIDLGAAARGPAVRASCPPWPATPPTTTSGSRRELAMAGKVQAICTAPLNKEALHAGGHVFPGHTELLAHLTGHARGVDDALDRRRSRSST